jgi:hypothetical protein
MRIHMWIYSDGSELVPTTDDKNNLILPILIAEVMKERISIRSRNLEAKLGNSSNHQVSW